MSLFEDTFPRPLKELLGQIASREASLPDFQRDFVWDPNMTQELIVSIAENYPAGSLLRIRNTHNLFASREFQGAPPLNGKRTTYLVLDGQQRLTSLYQAFFGVGEHRYYLDLRKLIQGADFEECIFHIRASLRRAQQLERLEVQAQDLTLPLSVLKGGAGGFSRWASSVRRSAPAAERDALEDQLNDIGEKWIRTIDDYQFPVVTLSDATSAEAVCTIFETLNRTGVKLSPFELLTARFWPRNVNLRSLWAKAKDDYPIIADFEIDPYYLLQVISLVVARRAPSAKRGDVLDLESTDIEEWWDRAAYGMAEGLRLLRDDCGVLIPRWLPYNTIVTPLAAVLAKLALPGSPQVGANRHKLHQWFWCSVFSQAYENAANSQSAKDVTELLAWLQGGSAPESVASFRFDPRVLRDTTTRQRALYRGAICLVLRRDSRDFHSRQKLTGKLIIENHVDDHHIFPQAYLGRQGVVARLRDCVLNRTLIDRDTNRRISDRAPADYMREIQDALDRAQPGLFVTLLDSHLLPAGPDSPLWRNDFEAFLAWRQDAIWNEIKAVTGVREAADLVEEEIGA